MTYEVEFVATLFSAEGKGAWTFAPVPEELAPSATGAWGRIPVVAEVDGRAWSTSIWRERSGRTLLPVPRHVRQEKEAGHTVAVRLRFNHL